MLRNAEGNRMRNRLFILLLCGLAVPTVCQTQAAKKNRAPGAPDKALVQKIWDGWNSLNPDNTAPFYARGQHAFFDVAPLRYSSWDEYASGVKKEFADYKAAKFMVNDDLEIHTAGDYAWGASTVKFDMTRTSGKRELGQFRWTVVWHKQDGQWLIVHEHVSVPAE